MKCLACQEEITQIDNEHLLGCCGLTLQEYAIRHHLPLDLLVSREELNRQDSGVDYPPPSRYPSERARAVLRGLEWAGLLQEDEEFLLVPGQVRRLDLLLWDLQALREYGFLFRQEYSYSQATHRVVAHNRLKAPKGNMRQTVDLHLAPVPPPDFLLSLAVLVAHVGELHSGYLFLQLPEMAHSRAVTAELMRHRIQFRELDAADHPDGVLLRTFSAEDGQRLLALLEDHLAQMPGALQRFRQATPDATVCKEVVFDSAHFITDHPAKCSNLHGGRYALHVKVAGPVDPVTGCVVDYGYLKRVVNREIVDRFDHHNLNYAAAELAWRSSTEMLCVYIWEKLIDYLPGLVELELHETPQSWCRYRGPTLEEYQRKGSDELLTYFGRDLRHSSLRRLIAPVGQQPLDILGEGRR